MVFMNKKRKRVFEKRLKFFVKIFNEKYKTDFFTKEEVWVLKKYFALTGFFNK